jgi:hypothetical protein
MRNDETEIANIEKDFDETYQRVGTRLTERKKRLLLIAIAARGRPFLDEDKACLEALDVAERFADGKATKKDMSIARRKVDPTLVPWSDSASTSREVLAIACRRAARRYAALAVLHAMALNSSPLMVGDSITKALLASIGWETKRETLHLAELSEMKQQRILLRDIVSLIDFELDAEPAWLNNAESLVKLAEPIYASGAFDRLPILADALEEAGCKDTEVLGHCRGPGPHVRGCWVVDLILGKE